MKRVLITGSRDWSYPYIVQIGLDIVFGGILEEGFDMLLMHGDCPTGVDRIARDWAYEVGCEQKQFPAQWRCYGISAGFKRNQQMVDYGANVCLAFIHNNSRGATDCYTRAKTARIPSFLFRSNG